MDQFSKPQSDAQQKSTSITPGSAGSSAAASAAATHAYCCSCMACSAARIPLTLLASPPTRLGCPTPSRAVGAAWTMASKLLLLPNILGLLLLLLLLLLPAGRGSMPRIGEDVQGSRHAAWPATLPNAGAGLPGAATPWPQVQHSASCSLPCGCAALLLLLLLLRLKLCGKIVPASAAVVPQTPLPPCTWPVTAGANGANNEHALSGAEWR